MISIENVNSGSGNDTIIGNSASNRLNGEAGNDKLYGNRGDDILIGGTGNDTLNGGKDSDTFIISTGKDTIEDFSITEGDQLLVHNSMKLTVEQFGNNLLLSNASHSIRTTLKGVDLDELLDHQPDLFD